MDEENGKNPNKPALLIVWDEDSQQVQLSFDPKQFKNWDFVKAILDMAIQTAEANKRIHQMQRAMQVQQEQAISQALRKSAGV